ncbi:glutathione S-transferase family protein [Bradyrhizobium genosp. P]|uniref:glutathione S-transferase family protein n=1 Tax=Bradyrhizobium genosp. P TaxID=83641 RepID=UPI003CF9086B
MIKLYDSRLSGNAWKVRILLGNLGIPLQRVTYALPEGKTYTPEFLAKNPLGKIPVVELDSGETVFESNAILVYFGTNTPFLPEDKLAKSRVMQWMFFEQAEVMMNLAQPRFFIGIKKDKQANLDLIKSRWEAGYKVLKIMDDHLAANAFFVGGRYSIADISLYTYASVAHEGEFEMQRFPNVLAWFERVRNQPGYVPLLED